MPTACPNCGTCPYSAGYWNPCIAAACTAAACAAWIHGRAGELANAGRSVRGVVLDDVLASLGHAWVAVAASELAVGILAGAAWTSRVVPPGDLVALAPVEAALRAMTRRTKRARTGWRARGDGSQRGSVRLRVVPLRGWRHARGVLAVECEALRVAGPLGEAAVAALVVRVESGSPCERPLRLLATRAGSVEARPEEGATVYRCALAGAERDVALAGLGAMMTELFVSATPSGRSRGESPAADEGVGARTAG